MKSIILSLGILFTSQITLAQQFNVIQVKGNRAIVEVQTGEKLRVGESYAVGKIDNELAMNGDGNKVNRDHLIGLDLSISSTKPDTTGAQTTLAMNGVAKFGWNKKDYEFGPAATFTYTKLGNLEPTTTFGIGGFGAYNFQPNVIGTDLIFSVDAQGFYNITKTGSTSNNGMYFDIGPFAKWYGLSDTHCLRAGAVFLIDQSESGSTDVTTSGLMAVVGLSTYF